MDINFLSGSEKINEQEPDSRKPINQKGLSTAGFIFIGLTGGVAVGLSVICLPFVSPALRRICLPYVPATSVQVNNVLSALTGRSGRLLDLGSGDGRIVLSAAKAGFQADGVELNPWLVLYSKLQSYRLRFNNRTQFYRQDLWKFNLQPYPNVVIFGVEEMMPELQTKLSRELCDEACVIACRFRCHLGNQISFLVQELIPCGFTLRINERTNNQ